MTEIKTEAGSVKRLRKQAARREAGIQVDRKRSERVDGPWDDARLASERAYATVAGVRLDDLSALLSLQDELVEALEEIVVKFDAAPDAVKNVPLGIMKARSLLTRIKSERDDA